MWEKLPEQFSVNFLIASEFYYEDLIDAVDSPLDAQWA